MKPQPLWQVLFLLLLLSSAPVLCEAMDYERDVARANDLYENQRFQEAIEIYEGLIRQGLQNGHLFYNLGNAYYRQGKKGLSILNYLRAQKLLPRNADLRANLNYATQNTEDKIAPKRSGMLRDLFFWLDSINRKENLLALALVNFLFWISFALWLIYRKRFFDALRKTALALTVVGLISNGAMFYLDSGDGNQRGVVINTFVEVKSSFGEGHVTLFRLHEGAVVSILGERGEWRQIQLEDDKKGWTPKTAVGAV